MLLDEIFKEAHECISLLNFLVGSDDCKAIADIAGDALERLDVLLMSWR